MDIKKFLASKAFAIAGVSIHRHKFGNKILRCYIQNHKVIYPIHLKEKSIEGINCINKISDLPNDVKSLSIVTPPAITEQIVEDAIRKGIKNIWIQPGAESNVSIILCKRHKINLIAGGPCILNILEFNNNL